MKGDSDNANFERRFGGIARLYGERVLEGLRQTHICIIGIGGVGSWVVEALARSGIGRLTLIDLDHIAESNINRQIHALSGELGRSKVEAMAERVRRINPECSVICRDAFIAPDNLESLISAKFDYVVDCIDAFKTKAALIAYCKRNKIRLVTVGGAGGQTDPGRIRIADLSRTEHDPLLSKTRKLLRKEFGFTRNLKRRFDVPCVYSDEQPRYPTEGGGVCEERSGGGATTGLNCSGFGSVTMVTATFGFFAAFQVLSRLEKEFSA